ncbi:3-isopropylmalate dehydratase small subunit [Homoserinibacter sp. YIM 151385]|uniref:3-isopropylmalate dehydratase small subunit n=1 Tax=Homoserinibacter sp. YIM 151385 TaxID=2985506 RepID=UPI0022F004AE|nr:3-isopropylmalate dehydratase small subunit [Homoserinibacter sp. YIM 151385]WBU36889.1 3-isopropylmalate dehydratase small subunit [Homoserinibacter sp. YIM 151385]
MEPVRTLTGTAAAIRRANIDTDQIIPAVWMKRVQRTGYGDGLFQSWRAEPGFVLDRPERAAASILLAGPNFGCGSSRQHAVWALRDGGIRAVVSSEIADIHRTNLPTEGLVPVQLPEAMVERLMDGTEADAAMEITIDVVGRTVTCAAVGMLDEPFFLDDASHHSLVNGFDPIDLTLRHADLIGEHEARRAVSEPWLPSGRPSI